MRAGARYQDDGSRGKMFRQLDGHHSPKGNAHQYGIIRGNGIFQLHAKGIGGYRFADNGEEPIQMHQANARQLKTGKYALVRA